MDVTGPARWLLRASASRPFLVTAVGGTECRLAVERVLRERGLRCAGSPSEADTLVECGPSGTPVDEAAERVWDQIGEPRARVRVSSPDEAAARLDDARAALLDRPAQRRAAQHRAGPPRNDHARHHRGGHGGGPEGGGALSGDAGSAGRGNHDHDHGGDGDLPGGLMMADRGDDRDGLRLDRLHIAIGPAQADWPAGLVVRLTVQGDVVQEAEVEALPSAPGRPAVFWEDGARAAPGEDTGLRAAAAADSLQRFLGAAGWPTAAATGRLLRDTLLAPDAPVIGRPRFTRWLRRVRRSWLLGWSLRGLGPAPADMPERLRGDAAARTRRWLDDIAAMLIPDTTDTFWMVPRTGGPAPDTRTDDRGAATSGTQTQTPAGAEGRRSASPAAPGGHPPSGAWAADERRSADSRGTVPLGRERAACARAAVTALPAMLVGQELAAVRLIVASFDPDLDALAAYPTEAAYG